MRILSCIAPLLLAACQTTSNLQPLGEGVYQYRRVDLGECNGLSSEETCLTETRPAIEAKAQALCDSGYKLLDCKKVVDLWDPPFVECMIRCKSQATAGKEGT